MEKGEKGLVNKQGGMARERQIRRKDDIAEEFEVLVRHLSGHVLKAVRHTGSGSEERSRD